MARYVLANRRAGKFTAQAKIASRFALTSALQMVKNAKILADRSPSDELARRVVILDADPVEITAMRSSLPADAILEPLIQRKLHRRIPIGLRPIAPSAVRTGTPYRVTIQASSQPLSDIEVMIYVRDSGGQTRVSTITTDAEGRAGLTLPSGGTIAFVEPIPFAGFWIMLAEAPPSGSTVNCTPIAKASANGGGWWHDAMGIDLTDKTRGAGIKVGVIDTGCGPHPNLSQVHLVGAFVDGEVLPPAQATDVAQHGTHTTGIIGARPNQAGDYAGMAPGCDLFHARVFKGEGENDGPTQADIIHAIDALSRDNDCDLINMSLGGGPPSEAEEDAIRDAAERGTLCICSAGNDASAVEYPAAYPECSAISAIGQIGWAPPGTFSASNRPQQHDMLGLDNLFLAAFSCFGTNLACAAPGVGIVSTVPDRGTQKGLYMEMDGTSMASPAACGVLAVILSKDAAYLASPRDISRTTVARNLLAQHCKPIGLAVKYEGRGLPQV